MVCVRMQKKKGEREIVKYSQCECWKVCDCECDELTAFGVRVFGKDLVGRIISLRITLAVSLSTMPDRPPGRSFEECENMCGVWCLLCEGKEGVSG